MGILSNLGIDGIDIDNNFWEGMSRINLQLYQPRTKLEQFEDIIMESKLLNGFNSSAAAAAAGGKLRLL